MAPITGKTVIVTGASRGIGLEFVKQFAEKGNRVFAACRSPEKVQKELESLGDVTVSQLDVASAASVEAWAASMKEVATHVDVVINNAGIYGPRNASLDAVTPEAMLEVFTTNAIGPLLVVQQLKRQGLLGGSSPTMIANITSKMGSIDDNGSGGSYAYRASKSAINIINKSLSIDLAADNVTSLLLHPGWVKTDMVGNTGLIDAQTSVSGMISVLEGKDNLQGAWWSWDGKEIPW